MPSRPAKFCCVCKTRRIAAVALYCSSIECDRAKRKRWRDRADARIAEKRSRVR